MSRCPHVVAKAGDETCLMCGAHLFAVCRFCGQRYGDFGFVGECPRNKGGGAIHEPLVGAEVP